MNSPHRKRSLKLAALANLIALTLGAHDWPEFRGPTGQGLSPAKDVPIRWSGTENVAWKTILPGAGWSSPVLVNDRLYLTTAKTTEGTKSLTLSAMCLDARDGKVLWSTDAFRQRSISRRRTRSSLSRAVRFMSRRAFVNGHAAVRRGAPE